MPEIPASGKYRSLTLDPHFLRTLDTLRLRLQRVARGRPAQMHEGSDRGGETDFLEHRPYSEGDDLRRLDWNVYARTGEPHIKVFGQEPSRYVQLVLDLSPSMHAVPEKEERACLLAAALAYLLLGDGHNVILRSFPLDASARYHQGVSAFSGIIDQLERVPIHALPAWPQLCGQLAGVGAPAGLTIVLSDFWGEEIPAAFSTLRRTARQEVCLLQVLSPMELRPSLTGPVVLHDAETGATQSLELTAADCARVAAATESAVQTLRQSALAHHLGHCLCPSDQPLETSVLNVWHALRRLQAV